MLSCSLLATDATATNKLCYVDNDVITAKLVKDRPVPCPSG